MRTGDIKVSFTVSVPYDNPDKNGVLYSRAAIQNALSSMTSPLPIRVCADNEDSTMIGNTTCKPYAVQCDEKEHLVKFTVDGVVYCCGMKCLVNERNGDTITDFEIVSFGLSE